MTLQLPDVARQRPSTPAPLSRPIEWVGMDHIDLPVRWRDHGAVHSANAQADIHVNLPHAEVRGIHMSRLYALVSQLGQQDEVRPSDLPRLLSAALASHADCDSNAARVRLRFDALVQRPALLSTELSGWRRYPVSLEATQLAGVCQVTLSVTLTYSSTCPCSAALSRQALSVAFAEVFQANPDWRAQEATEWLAQHGTLATPHSQRSHATLCMPLPVQAQTLDLIRWIDLAESALGTPVQTAVKRVDEQAFARLNGSNLMYVEDAVRRLHLALEGAQAPRGTTIRVSHLESLHPHDAVASSVL